MVAPDIQAIQRKLTVFAVILLVAVAGISTVALVPTLTTSQGPAGSVLFNVTFLNQSGSFGPVVGNIPYRQMEDITVEVVQENLTDVTFLIAYQDQSFSPFTNPAVSVQITGPEGAGTGGGSVSTAGSPFPIVIANEMPENQTVEATSEADALAKVTAGANNTTAGSGTWILSFNVGSALGPRPQGSIAYTIEISYSYYEGRAQRA